MKFFRLSSLLVTALPALVWAGGQDDVYFRGHGTGKGLGQAGAGFCGETRGYVTVNPDQYDEAKKCSLCIEAVCEDNRCTKKDSLKLYVVGQCDDCNDEGLDFDPIAFKNLTGSDPSSSAEFLIKWEFVDCVTSKSITDNDYQAGTVEAAQNSPNQVTILSEDESAVEKTKQENAVTASGNSKSGSSPMVVALAVVGVVACIALAAIAFVIKKKRMLKKRDDFTTRSFDTFSSPIRTKASIVKI